MKNLFSLLFFCFLFLSPIYSNGIGIVDGINGHYLEVVSTNVSVEVTDQISIVTATQVFKNSSAAAVNFKYAFPLNEEANPIGLRWASGSGPWQYADVAAGQQDASIPGGGGSGSGNDIDPNLIEYLGTSPLFFTPNDTIAVDSLITFEITYVELLPYFLGKVNFFLRNDYSALQNGIVINQRFDFVLNTDREVLAAELLGLDATVDISSSGASIHYVADEQLPNFDYRIEYELSSEGLGINALSTYITDSISTCEDVGQGYFTLIIEPESSVDTEVIEKNFTLIIDRSGSMSGSKIVQAKDAATFIIQNLNLGDKFNIVDFSSEVESFAATHQDYNVTNENLALNYIDAITAGGSTNISGALTTAIEQFGAVDPGKANIILFFTDGAATAGETSTSGILQAVAEEVLLNETNVFLFTFGVGASVNEALLTLLAQDNNGLVNFIEPENLEEDLTTFFLTINNPVLLNTAITFSPDIITEIYPNPLPNLYKGQQLIISGRYAAADNLNVNLAGQAFNVPVSYDFEFSLVDTNSVAYSFLPKLWAKQKIDALQLDYYLATGEAAAAILEEIDTLSVCYGVVDVEFSTFEDTTTETDEVAVSIANNNQLKIYPAPFTDHFNVAIPRELVGKTVNVVILNSYGQRIRQYENLTLEEVLQITGLQDLLPGVYFCLLEIDGKQYLSKVVKVG
jgi:Ca-activated chloride channel family protein